MLKTEDNNIEFKDMNSDMLSTAIVVLDKTLRIMCMNSAAENLFGKSRERVLNKEYTSLFSEEQIQHVLGGILKARESQVIRSCNLRAPNSKKITADCVISPFTQSGKVFGVILEMHRTDQQIRLAKEEQLVSQQEATQTLVRGMAHEIKNPLGGLRGAAQLLDAELESEELKEYTHIIISEADRLKGLVDRMLGSPLPMKYQLVNIHEVLERVRKLVKADIPENVNLRFDYDPSIPELNADKDHLIQIVFNIVGNALKAVGDSGNILFKTRVLRNITVNHKRNKLTLLLEIVDDGKGVPEEIRDKLFYPMISGSAQGTGLGLSIAQSLANRHHGVIEFTSKPGETRFILLLPIRDENDKNV